MTLKTREAIERLRKTVAAFDNHHFDSEVPDQGIEDLRTLIEAVEAITEAGMVVVPREPTPAMKADGADALRSLYDEPNPYSRSKFIYTTMLAAAEKGE